ncbi:MAG: hypothetical protein FJX67_14890 [Alphaproteobacteria bacterium]|nr:hypothetical protein [Alphaproteobacteria bacterium]
MAAAAASRRPGLALIVFSGAYARVHYALAMAAAAIALGRPVTLFFTMEGTRTLLGAGADGRPGWSALDGEATGAAAADLRHVEAGVAGLEELIAACRDLGAVFMVCEMGLRATGIARAALRGDIAITEGGLASFLADAGSQIVFV